MVRFFFNTSLLICFFVEVSVLFILARKIIRSLHIHKENWKIIIPGKPRERLARLWRGAGGWLITAFSLPALALGIIFFATSLQPVTLSSGTVIGIPRTFTELKVEPQTNNAPFSHDVKIFRQCGFSFYPNDEQTYCVHAAGSELEIWVGWLDDTATVNAVGTMLHDSFKNMPYNPTVSSQLVSGQTVELHTNVTQDGNAGYSYVELSYNDHRFGLMVLGFGTETKNTELTASKILRGLQLGE